MTVDMMGEREKFELDNRKEVDKKIAGHEKNRASVFTEISKNNLGFKLSMAEELINMGLSKEAIKRVLHITIKAMGSRTNE